MDFSDSCAVVSLAMVIFGAWLFYVIRQSRR